MHYSCELTSLGRRVIDEFGILQNADTRNRKENVEGKPKNKITL